MLEQSSVSSYPGRRQREELMVPLGSALLEDLIDLLKQVSRFDNIWYVCVSEYVQSSMWVAMVVLSGVRASLTPG